MRPRHWIALLLFLIVFGGLLGFGVKSVRDAAASRQEIVNSQQAELQCISHWVNTYSQRVELLDDADRVRLQALDVLVRSVRGPEAGFLRALASYLAASDRVNQQARSHPLPPAPQFLCAQLRSPRSPSPRATFTKTATRVVPGPARTVNVPGPARTFTVPGPTRTVTVPGPTRAVTVPPRKGRP